MNSCVLCDAGKSKIYAQSADSLIITGGKKSLVLFPAACIMTVLTQEHTQKPESPFNDCAHINEAFYAHRKNFPPINENSGIISVAAFFLAT